MASKTTKFTKSREVREMTVTLDYTVSEELRLFLLPAGSRIIDWHVSVKEAFAGGAVQELAVGTNDEPILEGVSLATAGRVALTTELVQPGFETTKVTGIYAMIDDDTNTAGEVDLTCVFSVNKLVRM